MIEVLNSAIDALSGFVFYEFSILGVPVQAVVIWLAIAMLFTTWWLGFPQIRGFALAWKTLGGKFQDATAPGGMTQFQALSTALASTVGLGNIAGVAVAITMGGPGAIFWMVVIGFFAMSLKCAEVTLGLMFREELPYGRIKGGPAVTLVNGLASIGRPKLGRMLAIFHAVFMLIGVASLFQVNQAFAQTSNVTGITNGAAFGIGYAILVAAVLLGSVAWMGRVTGKLVPAMCLIYVAACLVVIGANITQVPAAIATIVTQAFAPVSVAGGAVGVFIIGMRRAIYSSEAGIGTAVVAHAQARTRRPASEGMVALLEPFIDTVIICMLSGVTLVITGAYLTNLEGVEMTSQALGTVIPFAPLLLGVVVLLFSYSTVIANGFYATQAFMFLAGHGPKREFLFKLVYCAILPLGVLLDLGKIVDMVDSAFFLMVIPNVIAIYFLARPLRQEISSYLEQMKAH